MSTTPDYAGLSRSLGALAYHIQQTGTADGQDAQTCLEVAEALRTFLERNKELERHLGGLLAIIHRDGGHYRAQYGDQKAVDDAHKIWAGLITRAEAAEARLAEAMKVIGQIDNALNDQFAAGIEEREGGSALRQERLMKSGEELRRAARKFLKENGNGE